MTDEQKKRERLINELRSLVQGFSLDAGTVGDGVVELHALGKDFESGEFGMLLVPLADGLEKQDKINKLLPALLTQSERGGT